MAEPCCDRMRFDLEQKCQAHLNRFNCPDALVALIRGGFGLIVHDRALIGINFYPWCGSRLPEIGGVEFGSR